MLFNLLPKPYSTSSRLFPFSFSQFSFIRRIMKHRKDSDYAMDETDEYESNYPSISHSKSNIYKWSSLSSKKSLELYAKRKTNFDLKNDLNQISNEGKEDLSTSRPQNLEDAFKDDRDEYLLPRSFGTQKLRYCSGKLEQKLKKPFCLILPERRNSISKRSGSKQIEMENNLEKSYEILRSGMILLKNYISLSDQVEIVNICEDLGAGPGGFYQPGYKGGAKLHLQVMCLGRNWDPQTKYDERYRHDGSEAPQIPDELVSLVKNALQYSHDLINSKDEIPIMSPDICIVNFYTTTGRLGLHQDRDESQDSLDRGLPVVSISIGDSAEFLYSDKRDIDNANKVLLKSGDVLIFGGMSRHIFHGVKTIIPNSAPLPLLNETMLRPGRLNLTFRQF